MMGSTLKEEAGQTKVGVCKWKELWQLGILIQTVRENLTAQEREEKAAGGKKGLSEK